LAHQVGLGRVTNAAAVVDAARNGNEAAQRVVATVAERLATGVAAVIAVLDPELVLVGGGIGTGAGAALIDPMRATLARISPLRPRIAVAELGSAGVLDGAVREGLRLVLDDVFGGEARSAS
jgi:predicted NBD/HSP70 family sugar kinase